jgi:prolyl-tRNA synthetase
MLATLADASPAGEDQVVECPECNAAANAETAAVVVNDDGCSEIALALYDSDDGLHVVAYPATRKVNVLKLGNAIANPRLSKADFDQIDWTRVDLLIDASLSSLYKNNYDAKILAEIHQKAGIQDRDLLVLQDDHLVADIIQFECGDLCSRCWSEHGRVAKPRQEATVEVAHTFYLGTKYSEPLGATATDQQGVAQPMEMGCYGIGVSRLIGAIAQDWCDEEGIPWPSSVAPFVVVVIPFDAASLPPDALQAVAQAVGADDVLLDDRYDVSFGARMTEFQLMGSPWALVLGKRFTKEGIVELQRRQQGLKSTPVQRQDFSSIAEALQHVQDIERRSPS